MTHAIDRKLSHHQYLRERLEAEFPDADEETLLDTLEGLTKWTDLLAEVLRSQLDDQDLVAALKARIGDMQVRAGQIDERARKKRELVRSVMERADLKKLTEPDLTVSLRPTRAPPGGNRRRGRPRRILEAATTQARPAGAYLSSGCWP